MYLWEKLQKEEKRQHDHLIDADEYDRQHAKKYVGVMSSMSHTYGNALAYIQNYILNLFPEGLFKSIHVNSKLAHRQLRSNDKEYLKRTKPMIVFRPRIPSMDEERFLKGTLLTEYMTDLYHLQGSTNLMDFFCDPENDFTIKYQLSRTVMYVDVSLMFNTLMQQIDYWSYFQNSIRINHPFFLHTYFESYLPQDMLQIISNHVGIPLYDEMGNTKEFLTYMNQKSGYPITYKLQGSSQTREFYRYYPVSIDTIITDLDRDDGEQAGNIMQHYKINFTVKMEFYSNGYYFLFSDKIFDLKLPKIDPSNTELIPMFTDVILKEDLNLRDGWVLYNQGSFRPEKEYDVIDFNQMLNTSIKETMKYHYKNGLPIFDFIDVKVRKQGKMVHEGSDYAIDWDKCTIQLKNEDLYHTYHINICLNVEYVNNLIKTVYNLE